MTKEMQKRKGSNLNRPDTIQVTKFSEHQMDHGGLEHVTITQNGKTRILQCQTGRVKYPYALTKGDLIATGQTETQKHVWVITDKSLRENYTRASGKKK